ENTFRFISITFAQEFDTSCEKAGIDAREITTLAATKPFGFMPFYAGPGIGGHCIAEDPYYLYQSMLDSGLSPKILESALANHEARASVIVERIIEHIGGRPLEGAKILLLGVSYKPNVGDARRSPAQPILELLEAEGATVDYHDSLVAKFHGHTSVDLRAASAVDYDVAVLITAHDGVNYHELMDAGWNIFDTRGAIKSAPVQRSARRSLQRLGETLGLGKTRIGGRS
ncbi:MAG: UDP binding domain-containing protein, partial [Dehalococcoidia bacterium]